MSSPINKNQVDQLSPNAYSEVKKENRKPASTNGQLPMSTAVLVAAVYHPGCTDPGATNYNSDANVDDGSCTYPPPVAPGVTDVDGCMDPSATNYDPSANTADGSCTYDIDGCTDPTADNYDPSANTDNGSCTYTVSGCTDSSANNYDPSANSDDGSCTYDN